MRVVSVTKLLLLGFLGVVAVGCGASDEPKNEPVACTNPRLDPLYKLESCDEWALHRPVAKACTPHDSASGTVDECLSDSDCLAGQACSCDPFGAECVPADCNVDSDCPADQACVFVPGQSFTGISGCSPSVSAFLCRAAGYHSSC